MFALKPTVPREHSRTLPNLFFTCCKCNLSCKQMMVEEQVSLPPALTSAFQVSFIHSLSLSFRVFTFCPLHPSLLTQRGFCYSLKASFFVCLCVCVCVCVFNGKPCRTHRSGFSGGRIRFHLLSFTPHFSASCCIVCRQVSARTRVCAGCGPCNCFLKFWS